MNLTQDLITIVDNKAVSSAYSRTITEFKSLSEKDLAYIYFMADYRSPFSVYDWEQRKMEVKKSIFAGSKWKETSKIKIACDKYAELTETSAVKLLKAARGAINKLEKYFRNIDLTVVDKNEKPIYSAKDLISNLEKMGKVVDGISRLEDIVKKEEQTVNSNRGGVEVNKYSM